MWTGVVCDHQKVFVVYEFFHIVGEVHVEDVVGHRLVNLLPQLYTSGSSIYVQGAEFREVDLNVALVAELTEL